jgi:hypothetical protein
MPNSVILNFLEHKNPATHNTMHDFRLSVSFGAGFWDTEGQIVYDII